MSSLARAVAGRAALAAALLSFACQKDGDALFDNSGLDQASAGSGASASTGAQANAGTAATTGGSDSVAEGGEGGSGVIPGGGRAGEASEGGSAGSRAGSGGGGGKGEEGGSAGSGGTKPEPEPEPEPVTVELTDVRDTYVNDCSEFTNFGDSDEIRIDDDAPGNCTYESLLSVALDEIPEGALVSMATLTLTCIDTGGLIDVAYAVDAWTQEGVRWNNRPDGGAGIGSLMCTTEGAAVTLDLTAAVVAWLSGAQPNHGILLSTEASNGTDLVSAEGPSGSRPVLSVTYTPPVK